MRGHSCLHLGVSANGDANVNGSGNGSVHDVSVNWFQSANMNWTMVSDKRTDIRIRVGAGKGRNSEDVAVALVTEVD